MENNLIESVASTRESISMLITMWTFYIVWSKTSGRLSDALPKTISKIGKSILVAAISLALISWGLIPCLTLLLSVIC